MSEVALGGRFEKYVLLVLGKWTDDNCCAKVTEITADIVVSVDFNDRHFRSIADAAILPSRHLILETETPAAEHFLLSLAQW